MARIPRILKVYKIDFPVIGCLFTNGEYRIIHVIKLFQKLGLKKGQFGHELTEDKNLFNSVGLNNSTLSWMSLSKKIKLPSGKTRTVTFELDPVTIFENSKPDSAKVDQYKIGKTIKNLRLKLNLSQESIAQNIGSNKQYLSRIENDKSDLEFNTLKRIFELGFNKKLFISHFEENNFINTYSNSVFTSTFIDWIEKNNTRLDLIEGIGDKLKHDLDKNNIKTTDELANTPFEKLRSILKSFSKPISFYHFPETWTTQAKFLQHKDWFNLIKLQRMLISKAGEKETSKLEIIAKKETKHQLFEID